MFKTFNFGILLGILVTAGLLYLVPVVDQHREASLVSVLPNGGNSESFHVNLPEDRILVGMAGLDDPVPMSLKWPTNEIFENAQTELFKIRDRNDAVVGVASRITGSKQAAGTVIEWTLHLPARGSLYITMQPMPDGAGYRSGSMRAGTREFADMHGSIKERFIDDGAESVAGSGIDGRIELVTALVGRAVELQ